MRSTDDTATHVDPTVADLRTRVRFPPPPPIQIPISSEIVLKPAEIAGFLFLGVW
jgi:hypothetical protein